MNIVEVMQTAIVKRLKPVMLSQPTLADRQYRLSRVLNEYRLTNSGIWYQIMAKRGFLTGGEWGDIVRAYQTYKEIDFSDNTSVADLLCMTLPGKMGRDKFFRKVCFNYDFALGATAKLEQAVEDLAANKRSMVAFSDPEYWTVGQWVNYDCDCLLREHSIYTHIRFNRTTNEPETVYRTNPDQYGRHEILRGVYLEEVLPLLDPNEIIKPTNLSIWSSREPARVAKLFGDFY